MMIRNNNFKILIAFIFLIQIYCFGQSINITSIKLKGTSVGEDNQTPPDNVYPPSDLVITTHSAWASKHYPERIAIFKENRLETNDIIFLGNSITEQGGDWGDRFNNSKVKNRGIAGDTSDGVLARLGELVYVKPTKIFILIGVNDFFTTMTAQQVYENTLLIVNTIHNESPDTKIYVQTILPTTTESLKVKIQATNSLLQNSESAEPYSLVLLHDLFTTQEGLMNMEYSTDGIHLNESGYTVWVDNVNNLVIETPVVEKDQFYVGTTMGFVTHQETFGAIVFKENGVAKDPYQSIYDHGGNMVRFRVDLPPYKNNHTVGFADVDFRSPENVKLDMQKAKNVGLETLLTFSYASMALDPDKRLTHYVAPLAWQPIAHDLELLKAEVYNHTYDVLKDYVDAGLIPKIVSVGNEISWRFLEENKLEEDLPAYDAARVASLLNSGTKAIRDINSEYSLDIKIALHVGGVNTLKWWMETHMPHNLDFDIMGLSHYHGWTPVINDYDSWSAVGTWLSSNYNLKFMIMETAQLFITGQNDTHVNILGLENIPAGYENPPTPATQRLYLRDLAQEVLDANGIGVIVWGAEWVGSNTLIYADEWGAGSSWENKTFWDFNNNLHDGVNWMQDIQTEK